MKILLWTFLLRIINISVNTFHKNKKVQFSVFCKILHTGKKVNDQA